MAVVDDAGIILARNERHEEFVGRPATRDLQENTTGWEGTWRGLTADGTPVLGTYARSQLSGWRVAVGLPERTLTQPLHRSMYLLAVVGTTLAMLSLLLAIVVHTCLDKKEAEKSRAARLAAAVKVIKSTKKGPARVAPYASVVASEDASSGSAAAKSSTGAKPPKATRQDAEAEVAAAKIQAMKRGNADRAKVAVIKQHAAGDMGAGAIATF
jgi:hypothetical protein